MRISTPYQREEVVGKNNDQWNADKIIQNELLYIPKEK